MRKYEWKIAIVVLILGVAGIITCGVLGIIESKQEAAEIQLTLPKPKVAGGMRGEMGIDANINEETIDQYLGREDAVYRDMRMLVDEADYENIGGDSYLSGFVEGFEVIPYPKLVNVTGLPPAVGESYTGPALFTYKDGQYIANYDQSMEFLEYYFPKDKTIFLMCGGGGYAGMTKEMLVSLGWDADKIYNVGGYWYYDGAHKVEVKRTENGVTTYDFWKVPYHDINFEWLQKKIELPKTEQVEATELTAADYQKLIAEHKSFLVVVHMTICPAEFPLTDTTKKLVHEEKVQIYYMNEAEFKQTSLAERIKYLPSLAVIRDGQVVNFLDAESDQDLEAYKSVEALKSWLQNNGVKL